MRVAVIAALFAELVGVYGQTSTTFSAIPTLASAINYAPSLVPNIIDLTAPNSQSQCPGYTAFNVQETSNGLTADLSLAGDACNTYGNDIADLSLTVQYQSTNRLNVEIVPKYLVPSNQSIYVLPEFLSGYPSAEEGASSSGSDLNFTWTNDPSFQFKIVRKSSGDAIFDTYGKVLVFQDQFLELATAMPDDYNVYGLTENINQFRLGTNYTQTFYAVDAGNTIDYSVYGTHPFYMETRYSNGSNSSSHGVYARNAHAQEWLLRSDSITYRTIGGSFDFYFLSGDTPNEVIQQYQSGIVGNPAMHQYWTLGFHQCRWGYENWTVLQQVADDYAAAGIQLETLWSDIDYMDQYRDFTNGELNYPVPEGQEFLNRIHAAGQHYVPIVDSNIYAPDPDNSSDAYSVYDRGVELDAFIRNGNDSYYYGSNWPGFSVWTDWLVPQGQQFWTENLMTWYQDINYDGIWIDLSEASSFCVGSCGQYDRDENPAHPPFLLPGDPGMIDYRYPEAFNITNATEAASASSASAAQASSTSAAASSASAVLASATTSQGRTVPTPGVRNLNFPPYAINNVFPGHALEKSSISPNATHNDEFNTTEYEMHNLFGHQIVNATYHALLEVFPNRRPFVVGRSTFAGSGTVAGHWGGDNTSTWGSMWFAIAQALQFAMAGIPMFGTDTCGFAGNTDMELCNRWMQLSAFFPFYRNHNVIASIPQEAYRWASVAEGTRTVMQIRYSLLPYMYTLLQGAHKSASTVMRALAWEFPNEPILRDISTQFMLGPSLLITPVLEPLVNSVKGLFPGVADGAVWYDWYTLQKVDVQPGENKTLDAPLGHINVHVRGGSILPLQQPGNTTATSRQNPFNLLIALDTEGMAEGSLYLDDGVSIVQNSTKDIALSFANDTLTSAVNGTYLSSVPLANVTIAGLARQPSGLTFSLGGKGFSTGTVVMSYETGTLYATGFEGLTSDGVWSGDLRLQLQYGGAVSSGASATKTSGWVTVALLMVVSVVFWLL